MFTIEKMTKEDVAIVANIEQQCFPLPWTEQQIGLELYNPLAFYFVLKEDGSVVGYGGYLAIAGEANIMDIAIKKDCQSRGLGKMMTSYLIDTARADGLTALTLECRRNNIIARNLYEALGFRFCGYRPKYYENTEDAAIYWLYF